MTTNLPTASTTFALLLGAAEWPDYPGLDTSNAFASSANAFREYLGPKGLRIPENHVFDLFNSPLNVPQQISKVHSFVKDDIPRALAAAVADGSADVADLLIYHVGHGDFVATQGLGEMYCVFPQCANSDPDLRILTSLPIKTLFGALARCPVRLRKYFILDACYAAGAMVALQSPRGPAIEKDVYKRAEEELPEAGIALLCSSSGGGPSKIMPGEDRTMFTGALLEVLTGSSELKDAPAGDRWSLRQVAKLTEGRIKTKYRIGAIAPEVHSPDQRHGGDVADIALFPNPVGRAVPRTGPVEPKTNWCLVLSDWAGTDEGVQASSLLFGALLEDLPKWSRRSLRSMDRPTLADKPTGIHRGCTSVAGLKTLVDAVREICTIELAVFDLSELEPVVLFLLGIRAVARRGITICVHRDPHQDPNRLPFYLKELNLIPFGGRGREELRDRLRDRVALGFRLLKESPSRYSDLPAHDLVRWSPADPGRQGFRPARQQVLLLGPYNDDYRKHNLPTLRERLIPEIELAAPDDEQGSPDATPKLMLASEILSAGMTSQTVFEEIRFSKCCLVDWTGFSPNVFFELGVRVACNPISPVCVIADAHTSLSPQQSGFARLFNLIRYPLDVTSPDDPFKAMSESFFQGRPSNPIYDCVWESVSAEDEAGLIDVVQLLREAADPYESLAEGGYRIPPVYPEQHAARTRMKDAYLERKLAAWLYLDGRFGAATLRNDAGRWGQFCKLGRELLPRLPAEDDPLRQRIAAAIAEPSLGLQNDTNRIG